MEEEEEKAEEDDKASDHLLFLLDISASMNHDEKGTYQAPKSPDHPGKSETAEFDELTLQKASSIKKARELLVPLVLGALKRNSAVTVVLWNSRSVCCYLALLPSKTTYLLFSLLPPLSSLYRF
jgi:hypothetical protein